MNKNVFMLLMVMMLILLSSLASPAPTSNFYPLWKSPIDGSGDSSDTSSPDVLMRK